MSSVIVVRAGYLTLEKGDISVYLCSRCFISAYQAQSLVMPTACYSTQKRFTGDFLIGAK